MHKIIPVAPFDAVVFGATGDLTMRKLLPALYYRFRDRQIPEESRIVAAARTLSAPASTATSPRRRSSATCRRPTAIPTR